MRYALGVEYTGSHYHGWQKQSQIVSVQACIEAALSQVADHTIEVHVAGRTDAGVHAVGQVIHFETYAQRPDKAWVMGVNTHLPHDIRIRWAKVVDDHFHARFSATARRYLYLIDNREVRSAIWPDKATWFYQDLDADAMHTAAQVLLGENDFSTFRAAGCQSNTAMRNVIHCQVHRQDHWVWIDIKANAFLHHMVRNIVGSLFLVGSGERDKRWLADVFESKDRTQAGATAPAQGLYLVAVDYPQQYGFPDSESLFKRQLLVML